MTDNNILDSSSSSLFIQLVHFVPLGSSLSSVLIVFHSSRQNSALWLAGSFCTGEIPPPTGEAQVDRLAQLGWGESSDYPPTIYPVRRGRWMVFYIFEIFKLFTYRLLPSTLLLLSQSFDCCFFRPSSGLYRSV